MGRSIDAMLGSRCGTGAPTTCRSSDDGLCVPTMDCAYHWPEPLVVSMFAAQCQASGAATHLKGTLEAARLSEVFVILGLMPFSRVLRHFQFLGRRRLCLRTKQ